jgi:hypothetical protein
MGVEEVGVLEPAASSPPADPAVTAVPLEPELAVPVPWAELFGGATEVDGALAEAPEVALSADDEWSAPVVVVVLGAAGLWVAWTGELGVVCALTVVEVGGALVVLELAGWVLAALDDEVPVLETVELAREIVEPARETVELARVIGVGAGDEDVTAGPADAGLFGAVGADGW